MLTNRQKNLDWIDYDRLLEITKKNFSRSLNRSRETLTDAKTEPTLNILRGYLLNMSKEEIGTIEKSVALTKTFQNAIGDFHQEVLGSAKGWRSTGTSGGVLDIMSDNPIKQAANKKILAEVKMRYNTIKASDEKNTWDKLDQAARLHGLKDHVSYIIQIVPKKRVAYDQPWKVTGRDLREHVRCIDGTTAYYYVTGQENALKDLLLLLPDLLSEAFPGENKIEDSNNFVSNYFDLALPPRPYKINLP